MTDRWPRYALSALLLTAAALYLWHLSASGYGNTFYAAAAQAGSQSWSAWFFGSLDAHNFITVDKPPASLWVTGLTMRVFGVSAWSALAPQALMGVGAVAVLYFTVRRAFADSRQGAVAGLLAGAVLAFTPVATLIFRFNNPDALLVLLTIVAAFCLMRAVESASWRWLLLVAAVTGTAFLTKMLQAFLVLPGFALAYLFVAPTTWGRRVLHLLCATGALVIAAGWWILAVGLVPAAKRPYIGGSTDNTVLDLALGYNGISRILGHRREGGQLANWGGGPGLQAFGGRAGTYRLFMGEMGDEISWLLLAALVASAFGVYLACRGLLGRNELAALVMWTGWFAATDLVLSFMGGVVHPYYTIALAPAVAALVGLGAVWGWRRRSSWDGRLALAAMIGAAVVRSVVLLYRNNIGLPGLPWAIAAMAAVGVVGVLWPQPRPAAALAGLLAGLAGAATFSIDTAAHAHHGATPAAVRPSTVTGAWMGDEGQNVELARLLAATHTPWSAATNGSQSAAELEIASGTSVMAVGGWSGDPAPTLQQFIDEVHAGKISYYVEAGRAPTTGDHPAEVIRAASHSLSHTREVADWVAAHYPATTIGDSVVYRLT